MHPPKDMIQIIDRRRYSVATSTLLAGNDHWDGHNFERSGRNSFLYKTQLGAYFTVNMSQWQDEQDTLIPCSPDEAIEHFEEMTEHRINFSEAFPDVNVLDA